MFCMVRLIQGQNTSSNSKSRARITSCSSGPADAGRLTPALYKTQRSKHETQDRMISGLVSIRFRGLFFEVVISVGGFWCRQKMGVASFCLFLLSGCIYRSVRDFTWLFWLVAIISSWGRANRAVMFCWFSTKKIKTKVQGQNQGRV